MSTHDDQLEKRNVSKLTFGRVELVELNIVESGLNATEQWQKWELLQLDW